MELPSWLGNREVDCGCDNRREIMGAGEWQDDALIVGVVLVVAVVVFVVTR